MAYVVADVRSLSAGQYQHIIVYGSTALSDGGGGFYVWNAAAMDTDDGAAWIKPTSVDAGDPGRWQRVWVSPTVGGGYTDEEAQDAIGTILVDSSSIDFTYTDATPSITATAIFGTGSGTVAEGNHTHGQLHDAVTLAGASYLSLSGQQITAASINLATQSTGVLPATQAPVRATVTETGTTRTNTASDAQAWVRFTNTGVKSPVVSDSIATAGDVWIWVNAAATGKMTLSAGAGVTLTGDLVFDPGRGALIRFASASAADVIGGTAT